MPERTKLFAASGACGGGGPLAGLPSHCKIADFGLKCDEPSHESGEWGNS